MKNTDRKRFSLYVSDKETIEWLNAQKNISLSVNTLIRKFAVKHPNQDYIQYLSDSVSDSLQQNENKSNVYKADNNSNNDEILDKKISHTKSATPNSQADVAGNNIFENM